MFKYPKIPATLGLVIALLLGTSAARAGVGAIRDNAAFFSEPAKTEAARNISEIEKRYKKDLVIETFKEIPAEIKQGVDLTDKAAMSRMFEQWSVKQARQQKVNGVYILLSKEPAHLQIVVGNETQSKAFTLMDRDNLAAAMLGKLRKKQNDEALLEGVNFVSTTMAGHVAVRSRTSTAPIAAPSGNGGRAENSSPWGWLILVLLGAGAIWLVVGIFRSLSRGGGAAASPGMSPVSGGGGFFSSLLGGMFGAAAGMWLYDQFSGHGSAFGADQDNRGSNDAGSSGPDTDYSSSGGDFGGDSGGDSGGGDSGGDFGGGGDF